MSMSIIQLRRKKPLVQVKLVKKVKLMQTKLRRMEHNENGNQVVLHFRGKLGQQLLKFS